MLTDNEIPVSYTHLDVYKRQALGDGTACRVSLGDEDAGIFFQPFSFRVVEVDTAVTQFAVKMCIRDRSYL